MNFLEALFSGAKAMVRGLVSIVKPVIVDIIQELDSSSLGRATTRVVSGMA